MAYLVRITSRAERDLEQLYEAINASNSAAASRWYAGLKRAILSLTTRPNRCPITPENRRIRHSLYGRKPNVYRIIYRVNDRDQQVNVLHIRHGARRQLNTTDLE